MCTIIIEIGYVTTRDLMKMGASVIMACRSSERAEAASTCSSFTLSLITTFEFKEQTELAILVLITFCDHSKHFPAAKNLDYL